LINFFWNKVANSRNGLPILLLSLSTLKKYWLLFGVSVGIGLLMAFASYGLGRMLRPRLNLNGAEVQPPVPAVGFSFAGSNGQTLELQGLRGKLVLLYFGYTRCSVDCSPMLLRLAEARNSLSQKAGQVVVVFITIDPQHDTPADLETFLANYGEGFYGAVGTLQETHDLAASYDIGYATGAEDGISHTPLAFLIDTAGCKRSIYPAALSAGQIGADLQALLQEPPDASPCAVGFTQP